MFVNILVMDRDAGVVAIGLHVPFFLALSRDVLSTVRHCRSVGGRDCKVKEKPRLTVY